MIVNYDKFINEQYSVDRRGDDIYYIPIDYIWNYREFDRLGTDNLYPESYVNDLIDDIKTNGIQTPITLQIDILKNTALVVEGNHRIAIARMVGIDIIPTRVHIKTFGSINAYKAKTIDFDRYEWRDGIFK